MGNRYHYTNFAIDAFWILLNLYFALTVQLTWYKIFWVVLLVCWCLILVRHIREFLQDA